MMPIIVTLATGKVYNELASRFLPHLANKGNEVLVCTDSPSFYPPNIQTVLCPQDGTHTWHHKRYAVREGLKRSGDVVFMDGDHRLFSQAEDRVPLLQPISGHGFVTQDMVFPMGATGRDVAGLDLISKRFGIGWTEVMWWGCHLFAISDDGKGSCPRFLDFWDEYAIWLRDEVTLDPGNALTFSDSTAMGFAAKACGITPRREVEFFRPIISCFLHLHTGSWRQGDFP